MPPSQHAKVRPIKLPAQTELASAARGVAVVSDAIRLGEWCERPRPVTAGGVLDLDTARQAVEELRLWRHSTRLHDPAERDVHSRGLESAADLPVLNDPWRLARAQGLIETREGMAVCGARLPRRDDEVLACWTEAFTTAVGEVAREGGQMISRLLGAPPDDDQGADVVTPMLVFLYSAADDEVLNAADGIDRLAGSQDPGGDMTRVLLGQSLWRLLPSLSDLGAAFVISGHGPWSDQRELITMLFSGRAGEHRASAPHVRLTPLGRYGVRRILSDEGISAPVIGDLASEDAASFLDAVSAYSVEAQSAEVSGWLKRRDEPMAALELLDACADPDPIYAPRRLAALSMLEHMPGDVVVALLEHEATREEGCRHHLARVAVARFAEDPREDWVGSERWMLIDMLTANRDARPDSFRDHFLETGGPMWKQLDAEADELWRCDHAATADTLETVAEALRPVDSALAKRLRRSAMKARSR